MRCAYYMRKVNRGPQIVAFREWLFASRRFQTPNDESSG